MEERGASGPVSRPVLAIGPEGGWTDDEVARLEAHGFRRMSLGPRILRTDTATIALLARLMPAPLSHGAPYPCEGRH
jgi:RsmE family RNA methyltransferase